MAQVSGASSYKLSWHTDSYINPGNTIIDNITTTSYTHKNLSSSLTYYYVVSSIVNSNESYVSVEKTGTPIPGPNCSLKSESCASQPCCVSSSYSSACDPA